MTGISEYSLNVYLGKNNIAHITLTNEQLHWQYSKTWQQVGYAVSPHLPLHSDIPPINTQRFLRNLLPEGNFLDELISNFHLSRNNIFGLVRELGLDMPGSLIILSSQQSLPKDGFFRIVTEEELEQRLSARDELSLIMWDAKPRLSVAGVQDKINVTLNKEGQLGFGEGSLCSTHILKFEKSKLPHLVLNEYITMQLAKACGLTVANVKLQHYGENSALLVERFDRKFISMNEIKRRHMIDGCQALNLSPEYKYERNFGSGRDVAHIRDGASFPKLFDFATQCANPALTKLKMLDWVLFNLLIFNYDAHGKNISFFVGANGFTITPFYDLVNIKAYSHFEQQMAMGIGDEFDGEIICAYHLADFADTCQIPRSLLTKRLKYLINKLTAALNKGITQVANNEEEKQFLLQYQSLVYDRCKELFHQADEVTTIEV